MFINVTKTMFHNAFRHYNRLENFSYEARETLFDYFDQYEKGTGEKIELDMIATRFLDILDICRDFNEDKITDVLKNYNLESLEELKNKTMVLWNNDENVLYQVY